MEKEILKIEEEKKTRKAVQIKVLKTGEDYAFVFQYIKYKKRSQEIILNKKDLKKMFHFLDQKESSYETFVCNCGSEIIMLVRVGNELFAEFFTTLKVDLRKLPTEFCFSSVSEKTFKNCLARELDYSQN